MSNDSFNFGCLTNVIGVPLLLAGVLLLIWNEYHQMEVKRLYGEARQSLVTVTDTTTIDPLNEGRLVYTKGYAHQTLPTYDPLYGVGGNYLAVQRRVMYLQWKEYTVNENYVDSNGDERTVTHYNYKLTWVDNPIDSKDFHVEQGHENSVCTTIASTTFYSADSRIGAYKLDQKLVDSIPGIAVGMEMLDVESSTWAAAIDSTTRGGAVPCVLREPGEVYYSKSSLLYDNADWQEVGDVKVTFYVRPACFVWVMAQQRGHGLRPYKSSDGYWFDFARVSTCAFDAEQSIDDDLWGQKMLRWSLRIIGWLMVVGGLRLLLNWLTAWSRHIALLGWLLLVVQNSVSWVLGTLLALTVIAVSWIVVRPLLGLGLLAVVAAAIGVMVWLRRRARAVPPPLPPESSQDKVVTLFPKKQ